MFVARLKDILGIHHVAILGHNVGASSDFYERVLGLEQSKDTVGSPQSSALYFRPREHGEGPISMLQILTGEMKRGPSGCGEISAVALSIPSQSSARWLHYLRGAGVAIIGRASAFREEHLCFADPDGLSLSLVEDRSVTMKAPRGASAALDFPVLGFRSVELQVMALPLSAKFLTEFLGFTLLGREGPLSRFGLSSFEHSDALDLLSTRKRATAVSTDALEHVVWRVADRRALHRLAAAVQLAGFGIEISERMQEPCTLRILGPEGIAYLIAADPDGMSA